MPNSELPERASLEYLKKLAKDRLQELRRADPTVKLAEALLAIAREHGFASWRALKGEIEHRHRNHTVRFFEACASGDVESLQRLLAGEPGLSRATDPGQPHAGWTGLHSAAQHGNLAAVRLLLEAGADPNAREAGDNTCAPHWAAAHRHVEVVRTLLDAGGDVHGFGDVHELDTIGWATVFHNDDGEPGDHPDVVRLLLERGARHHIFSAIAAGDPELIRSLVEPNPEMLDRRMSRFEHGQTPLHYAMSLKRYGILDLLIDLGADLEAGDGHGRTTLSVAMLHGDREAMIRLHAAGAKQPDRIDASNFRTGVAQLAGSVQKGVVGIGVPDVARTLDWYKSIGFREIGRYADGGVVNWGMLAFGKVELMLGVSPNPIPRGMSLWFYTTEVDELYQLFKSRQLEAAEAALAGTPDDRHGIVFEEDIYDPFYGGRQFSIRDLNGYNLVFYRP